MSWVKREEVKQIVSSAVRLIADYEGDIENREFPRLGEYHKHVLMTSITELMAARGHIVVLTRADFEGVGRFGELIDCVRDFQGSTLVSENKIQLGSLTRHKTGNRRR